MNIKPLLLAGLTVLVMTSQTAQAQNPYYNQYGYNYYGTQYSNPYQNYNAYNGYNNANNYNRPQNYNYNGYANNAYYRNPYNNYYRYNSNRNGKFGRSGMPFTGNSDFMEELWPGRDSIYEDVLPIHGPWDRGWGRAPWNRDYDNLWGRNGGPSKWFDPGDPEEGIAEAWEDMMITPNRLGTMPGGWKAPSISIPNPIDVNKEFRDAAIDMPGEMQNFSEGFTYGGDDGYDDPDRGSIGFGNKKKDSGVSISPKVRR